MTRLLPWVLLAALLTNTHAESPDPSNQSLVFMPTAFTPPRGTICLRHLEVLFLNLNYSTSDWTSIGVGAMIPVTDEFNLPNLSVKQQILKSRDQGFALALAGNIALPIGSNVKNGKMLWTGNLVLSSQLIPFAGLHGMVGLIDVGEKSQSPSMTFGAGSHIRLASHVILLAEYLGAPTLGNQPVKNLIDAGIRWHGKHLAADICVMKPIGPEAEWPAFPILNFTYRF